MRFHEYVKHFRGVIKLNRNDDYSPSGSVMGLGGEVVSGVS